MTRHGLSRLLIGAALVLDLHGLHDHRPWRSHVSAPAVPLTSHHVHFDHHWYVWLPRHPTPVSTNLWKYCDYL